MTSLEMSENDHHARLAPRNTTQFTTTNVSGNLFSIDPCFVVSTIVVLQQRRSAIFCCAHKSKSVVAFTRKYCQENEVLCCCCHRLRRLCCRLLWIFVSNAMVSTSLIATHGLNLGHRWSTESFSSMVSCVRADVVCRDGVDSINGRSLKLYMIDNDGIESPIHNPVALPSLVCF